MYGKAMACVSIFCILTTGCYTSTLVEPGGEEKDETSSEKIQHVHNLREGWTIVRLTGDTVANVTIDSISADELSVRFESEATPIPIDSIAVLIQANSTIGFSTHSKLMGLAGAIIGGIVFWNNIPDQTDQSLSGAFVYGIEFGGAMLVGAIAGLGVGYLIDRGTTHPETFDLTRESPFRKRQIIGELFSQPF